MIPSAGKILVVDDDAFNRILLQTNLEEEGYRITVAEQGKQALEMLRAHAFDLVLTDLLMPEMNGFDLLQVLKAEPAFQQIPVIVISGEDDMENVIRCIEMGAMDYLQKPFDPVLLRTRVRNALQASGRIREPELSGRILIVDDDAPVRALLASSLAEQGYAVETAETGRQSLDILHKHPCDVVLLDLLMPEMDGVEVLTVIKADSRFRNIPVTMITSENDLTDIARCIKLGAEGFLFKPFEPVLLKARVAACVEKKRLRDLEIRQSAELEAQKIELKEKNAQLQELNASKDKFFSIIAHDLRNPLLAVSGYSQLLQNMMTQQAIGGMLQQTAEKLGHSIGSLLTLLENLLTWSRLQRGLITYQPSLANLPELIEENIILFEASAEQKGITLTSDVSNDTCVYADEIMVKTILRNLISNALKFTKSGGTITVSAHIRDQHVAVSIRDTGCGMAPEALDKLFRLDTHYTNVGTAGEKGTGLGLLLCKDLVEQNSGTIRVESTVGQGTTFSFTLPSHPPSPPSD